MNILWFRRGLRLHDNPALLSALEKSNKFAAVFIFDPPGGWDKPYHFHSFMLECLADLNASLKNVGTKLHIFIGEPVAVFRYLHRKYVIEKLCFEQDCEPIWHARDNAVKDLCSELNIEYIEKVSHTLWDPMEVITANGGSPPLTYDMFVHVAQSIGEPPKPVPDPEWDGVDFQKIEPMETEDIKMFSEIPKLGEIGVKEIPVAHQKRKIIGGETNALKQMILRLEAEEKAFLAGLYQPNQARPDILGPSLSLSSAITLGAISVRLVYWKIHEIFNKISQGKLPNFIHITGQLIWREYFYTMARLNPNYHVMIGNPICLQIPWETNSEHLEKWKKGMTGYPFIDAGQRQLLQEGWMHHSVRNAVAMFLTRGDLWLNWDLGAEHFNNNLVDGDWAVNAGNWLWVSSSAFERLLNCSVCIDSVQYGRRLEPSGDYIRRYVPELANFEFEYIHEPWKAPLEVQQAANCIIGRDYPKRMVVHEEVSPRNQQWMKDFRQQLMEKFEGAPPVHCQPSSENEIYRFFCLAEEGFQNLK